MAGKHGDEAFTRHCSVAKDIKIQHVAVHSVASDELTRVPWPFTAPGADRVKEKAATKTSTNFPHIVVQ